MTHDLESILVTRLRFMGDIVLTTPLLSVLRRAYPHAHIGYLAEAPYAQLLQPHPWVDSVYELDRRKGGLPMQLLRSMRRRKWDLAIDLFGNPRSALLTFLSGAAMRIGGDFRGRRCYYTHRIRPAERTLTAIQFHLSYLQPLHLQVAEEKPMLQITDAESQWAADFLAAAGYDSSQPIVGLHPGATWPAKKWFPDRFAELARKLRHEAKVQILFTCGPGEETLVERVVQLSGLALPPVTVLPLRQLAAVIKRMRAFVSNDCGPLHLAPAVGTAAVGLFGPGEPEIWFPYKAADGHRLVYQQVDCSRCHRDFCETMACMKAISVAMAYDQTLSALAAG
ncbi:glycosyltransferase family 9 protein [bacterium]|nr:glycosyltransferase family 9 protein [bacterium]